jgi:hypothetical protein
VRDPFVEIVERERDHDFVWVKFSKEWQRASRCETEAGVEEGEIILVTTCGRYRRSKKPVDVELPKPFYRCISAEKQARAVSVGRFIHA